MKKALTINKGDNVAVALADLLPSEKVTIGNDQVEIRDQVPAKHKFALINLAAGDQVIMYGVIVGKAAHPIAKGEVLTTENTLHQSASYDIGAVPKYKWDKPDVTRWSDKVFLGYHRRDGQVGTANYWLVFPLVFCENRNIETVRKAFTKGLGLEKQDKYELLVKELALRYGNNEDFQDVDLKPDHNSGEGWIFENVDGIRFLTHQGGCGGTRQDAETLCRLLAGYVKNPNVGGVTVLSLGCQNAEVKLFTEALKSLEADQGKPVLILDQQETGLEKDLIARAIAETFRGLVELNKVTRQPASPDKLTIGLECGGSDGFSGISANPSLGYVSDIISALGGKTILSEFPELCGVEQELINRCASKELALKFSELMRSYQSAAEAVGSGFDMNPSPGNIKDGLITDAMKSAGAAKKGGTSNINDVLDYTEYAREPGLNLLCTPGNDVESTTALAGSGANIIFFTTGLGTPTGNPVTPVIKVASNSKLATRMSDIIDIDTGPVITGTKTIEEMGAEMFDFVLEVASGRIKTKAMLLDQFDFMPWKRGVSL